MQSGDGYEEGEFGMKAQKQIRTRLLSILNAKHALRERPPSATELAHIMKEKPATVSSELCKMFYKGIVWRGIRTGPGKLRTSWRYRVAIGVAKEASHE